MEYRIIQVNRATKELVEAMAKLIPQLSIARSPDFEELEDLLSSGVTSLLIARENESEAQILGALALVTAWVPTGRRAWIEDVIVEQNARGRGIGEALVRAALALAREKGARVVELTSNPGREAANRLYRRIGFVQPQTNFYRYYLE